jgi:hypothetical protein
MTEEDVRWSPWQVVQASDPRIKPAAQCPKYDRVYRPMKVDYEGACKNYDYTDRRCVYCTAHMMSLRYHNIPIDVRVQCDNIMGW